MEVHYYGEEVLVEFAGWGVSCVERGGKGGGDGEGGGEGEGKGGKVQFEEDRGAGGDFEGGVGHGGGVAAGSEGGG